MNNKGKGPKMVDIGLFIQAGINPKNGLPLKLEDCQDLKKTIKRFLRLIDEQDAVNRYKWFNIPFALSSEEIERLIYYRGQLAGFYMKETGKFLLLPYALNGTLDLYGRFNIIKPLPFTAGAEDGKREKTTAEQLLEKKKLVCRYEPMLLDEVDLDVFENSCVLLHDYTKQVAQTIVPRWEANDAILDLMADIICFLRTGMLLGTGIKGIRVDTAEQADEIYGAARQMIDQARRGQPWIPLPGATEFQELADATLQKTEDFLLALQALDNIRLEGYGLPNGGIFEKKAHILESEQAMNQQAIDRVYQDGLSVRQNFCNIFNSIYGTQLWVVPSESVLDTDINGDGLAVDMKTEDNVSGGNGESSEAEE